MKTPKFRTIKTNKIKPLEVYFQQDQLEFLMKILATRPLGVKATIGEYVEKEVKEEIRNTILHLQG